MNYKFNFDENQILNHQFAAAPKGYDALEVDRFFDKVIKDYKEVKKILADMQKLKAKYDALHAEKVDFEAKCVALEKRLADYGKVTSTNQDNYENMQKIAAYEKFLWTLGHDPKKIK